jgi:hypothetical protein
MPILTLDFFSSESMRSFLSKNQIPLSVLFLWDNLHSSRLWHVYSWFSALTHFQTPGLALSKLKTVFSGEGTMAMPSSHWTLVTAGPIWVMTTGKAHKPLLWQGAQWWTGLHFWKRAIESWRSHPRCCLHFHHTMIEGWEVCVCPSICRAVTGAFVIAWPCQGSTAPYQYPQKQ